MAVYLEQYYAKKGICSDIFYIDITMEEPIYGVPFNIKVQFTDYFPLKLAGIVEAVSREVDIIVNNVIKQKQRNQEKGINRKTQNIIERRSESNGNYSKE